MMQILTNYVDISTSYNKNQIANSATKIIELATYYEFYKIIMTIIIPIIVIIGILVICYRLEKLNIQMKEQNKNTEALLNLGIMIKNQNENKRTN